MELIGLLGGMSWESSAEYYRLANEIHVQAAVERALAAGSTRE